jgi:hypothetical protein
LKLRWETWGKGRSGEGKIPPFLGSPILPFLNDRERGDERITFTDGKNNNDFLNLAF